MLIEDKNFKNHKEQAVRKMEQAIKENKIDLIIIDLLHKINSNKSFFTTSSCAGRIVIMQLPEIGDKKNAVFLGRWHREITKDEVFSTLNSFEKDQIWLLTQPPIFHIGCKNLSAANELMKCGIRSGFKHSSIRSISARIIVELQSTERMDMPLGNNGTRIVSNETIPFLVKTANHALKRSQEKLIRLEKEIEKMKIN